MFPYHHSRLSLGPDSIRLLRLKPCKTQSTAKIHCELFDYNLQDPSQRTHLYDALSYVWGNPEVTRPIYIGQLERELPVTTNLYAALLHLRNSSLERIIWIDAICIDQKNDEEKAQQIQLMAKIYSQASRVLVWLGEAADNSDQALKEIRAAGRKAIHSLNNETIRLAIDKLLKRDWFQRIWVRE
ncbi:HET-domain-containing protein [Hyaloscypha hepaticicola]|uniref:HET-domain-containing protein n=1 Tax=Hyaloscypha hepaticicola TaxID=2082293 RepID=A0A2J6Q3H0_9HELO|nr:HET-domain-containing protein [Hyaloscypha hepaticicola]